MADLIRGEAWERITGTAQVYIHPCVLFDIVAVGTVLGQTVTIYDGQDVDSGRLLMTLTLPADLSLIFNSVYGIHISKGLYAVLGANVSEAAFGYSALANK